MPVKHFDKKTIRETISAYNKARGNISAAAESLQLSRTTYRGRLEYIKNNLPDEAAKLKDFPLARGTVPALSPEDIKKTISAYNAARGNQSRAAEILGIRAGTFGARLGIIRRAFPKDAKKLQEFPPARGTPHRKDSTEPTHVQIRNRLRKKPLSVLELCSLTGLSSEAIQDALKLIRAENYNLQKFGDKYSIEATQALPAGPLSGEELPTLVSREDNTFLFGASGDQHLGSKYSRLDVLNDLYDRFAAAGVQCVYNTGNWIDGEARFNKHDLLVHGMEQQCRYLAKHYPQREGIVTYAVAGDDHEGWYAQREGVDIGRFAERIMQEEGRNDWRNLGYMESYIRLVNANSGKSAILAVVHPGGGSAYALSYSIQKIIEALDGGEKPAVGLYGHYHKLWAGNIRNVWTIQTGTTKDQDPFMRKKKIDAHVGGVIVRLEQDPRTGAILGCEPNMIRYFNEGYYQGRWNYGGAVRLPKRRRGG